LEKSPEARRLRLDAEGLDLGIKTNGSVKCYTRRKVLSAIKEIAIF